MNSGMADALISDFGRSLGMPDLNFGATGACQLVIDGRWRLTIADQSAAGQLLLHCPLLSEPAESLQSGQLLLMLRGNFMGLESMGGMLSVGPDGLACICTALSLAGSGADMLQLAVERLLASAEAWAVRLSAPTASPGRRAPSSLKLMA